MRRVNIRDDVIWTVVVIAVAFVILAGGGTGIPGTVLAPAIIGGLLVSTLLTLVVVPVSYKLLEKKRSVPAQV